MKAVSSAIRSVLGMFCGCGEEPAHLPHCDSQVPLEASPWFGELFLQDLTQEEDQVLKCDPWLHGSMCLGIGGRVDGLSLALHSA